MKTVGCETWKPMAHVECIRRGLAWASNRRGCQTPQRFHNQHDLVFKFRKHHLPVFKFHKQHLALTFHLALQVCKLSNRSWAKYHLEKLATSLWICMKMWSDFQVVPRFRSCHQLPVILSCHGQISLVPPEHACSILQVCTLGLNSQRWHLHKVDFGWFWHIDVIHMIQVIYISGWRSEFLV